VASFDEDDPKGSDEEDRKRPPMNNPIWFWVTVGVVTVGLIALVIAIMPPKGATQRLRARREAKARAVQEAFPDGGTAKRPIDSG